jgi:nucleoside-diphosphate-sugar epimerase
MSLPYYDEIIMKIMVTGNTGYIGPVLAKHLLSSRNDVELIGFDTGYFAHCLTDTAYLPEFNYKQHWGDLRHFPFDLLDGVDAVVHLAAISNDPMGTQFTQVTEDINYNASIQIARAAKVRGVKSFVFASSCSMYGSADSGEKTESDDLNPLTAYARSKVAMEKSLENLADADFIVTALRFSTACGMSDRLRLDLVLNDFVVGALTSGEISVLSDGTPWRPLIDVKDMSRAIDWALDRFVELDVPFLPVNAGSQESNYQVKDLAHAVADIITGTKVSINTNAQVDKRSYRVNFEKFKAYAQNHQPQVSLEQSINDLRLGLENMNFTDANFRSSQYIRLKTLENHIASNRLNQELKWNGMSHVKGGDLP